MAVKDEIAVKKDDFFNPNDIYQKSNILIGSKYKSTILENKVMAVVLSQINSSKEDKEGSLIVNIPAAYLREKLSASGGSFYDNLERTASRMTGRVIGISDRETEHFMFVPIISKAEYRDGVFTVRFVPEMKKHLKSLKANFTQMRLSQTLSFKYNTSLRLFEILKSRCYTPKNSAEPHRDKYEIKFSLSELKLEMGVVNAEIGNVKAILLETGMNGEPDYDRAVAAAKDQVYAQFGIFRRDCLDKAIKEINEKTEMNVELETHRTGKNHSVNAVTFRVRIDKTKLENAEIDEESAAEETEVTISDSEKDECIDAVLDIIEERIKASQARSIAEAAGYQIEKVRRAYQIAKNSSSDILDITAWMIAAIKRGYEEPVMKKAGKKPEKNSFHNFTERNTDYSGLFTDFYGDEN